MNMHTTLTFTIDLTPREFDLVTKGLCRTLKEGAHEINGKGDTRMDVEEALLLAEKLMDGRIREAKSQVGRATTRKLSAEEVIAKLGVSDGS